jgi:hypothetical protein
VRERPILMSAPMVRAILAGQKTQTRRVMARQKKYDFTDYTLFGQQGHSNSPWKAIEHAPDWPDGKDDQCTCPYASHRGDRLWVREAFSPYLDGSGWWYWADGNVADRDCAKPKPSIHMPRAACRLLLEVTGVRVERLREISTHDCWAEGIPSSPDVNPVHEYEELWESINGPGSWKANPWVWCVSFRRVT